MGASSPSTFAMLLQMVFEKFAKAALLRQGAVTLEWAFTSHGSASRMLLVLRRQRALFAVIGGDKMWEDVLWAISEIERSHPQLAQSRAPRLEYPWEDAQGVVRWPSRDLSIAVALGDPRRALGLRVVRFAQAMSARFDEMFP